MTAEQSWWQWLLGLLVAGAVWLVRKVFTNDKMVALVRQEVQDNHSENLRSNTRLEEALNRQSEALNQVVKELHNKADKE